MDQKCRDRVVLGQVPGFPGSSTGKESAYSTLPTYIVGEGSYAFQSELSLRTPKPRCNTEGFNSEKFWYTGRSIWYK